MVMTEYEIVRDYRESRNPEGQIRVLAELNDVEVSDIKSILASRLPDYRDYKYVPLDTRRSEELSGGVAVHNVSAGIRLLIGGVFRCRDDALNCTSFIGDQAD